MNTKLVKTIREAIALAGLKDGMTISFHHHLRNGDYVLNLVMDEIAAMGIRDLTVNASALFDTHAPLLDHIKNHVVRKVQTNYISAGIGRQISAGLMDEPVEFRTHGGRPRDIALGITPIDVAFIAEDIDHDGVQLGLIDVLDDVLHARGTGSDCRKVDSLDARCCFLWKLFRPDCRFFCGETFCLFHTLLLCQGFGESRFLFGFGFIFPELVGFIHVIDQRVLPLTSEEQDTKDEQDAT